MEAVVLSASRLNCKAVRMMVGPLPLAQVIGGLIGGFAAFAVGWRLFQPRKPGIGWLAGQLRTLGALTVMSAGTLLGQIVGSFVHTLLS